MRKHNAFLIQEPVFNVFNKIPIKVLRVEEKDLFPVKFEYCQRGYKGLEFSERKNKIEFL